MKNLFKKFIVKVISWEAKMVVRKYKPKIVAVTGSVGKTSTKDAIYVVLASTFSTRKNEKSFNSEIGVPLTILGCPNGWFNPFVWLKNIFDGLLLIIFPHNYPKWLVLEAGADHPGDIKSFADWVKPNIAVITRFGDVPVHVEFFPSIDDLIREKGYLAEALKPDGVFVFNNDDKRISDFSNFILRKKFSYSLAPGGDVEGSDEQFTYGNYEDSELEFPNGVAFKIKYRGSVVDVTLAGALGRQHIYPILAAFAVGVSQGIAPEKIGQSLKNYISPKARMKLIAGVKDTLIIDDTYNSSPVAVHEALRTLKEVRVAGKKVAVLADMMELGQFSVDEHKRVGEIVAQTAQLLITVGIRSRATADAALDAGMNESSVLQCETSQEAGKLLESLIAPGDIVLVKGSQSMRMERVVEEVMAHPENRENLLVRQDKVWRAKK